MNITVGPCGYKQIDWNSASELGLIERINEEILHPLGLAMYRDPATGASGGLLIADDGKWQYSQDMKRLAKLSASEIHDLLGLLP